jgi:hypothetical protein
MSSILVRRVTLDAAAGIAVLVASNERRHDAHASIGYRHTSRRFTKGLAP